MKRNTRGFTLVELMVVVAVLGVLVAVAVPVYNASTKTARANTCHYNLKAINVAVRNCQMYDIITQEGFAALDSAAGLTLLMDSNEFTAMPVCPSDGSYVKTGSTYSCTVHGLDAEDAGPTPPGTSLESILNAIKDSNNGVMDYFSVKAYLESVLGRPIESSEDLNRLLRQYYYEQNKGWPTFSAGEKDTVFYVKPMLHNKNNAEDSFFYATTNDAQNDKWQATYIYNKDTGTWFKYTGTGPFNTARQTWPTVKDSLEKNPDLWQEDTSITLKPK